MRDEESNDKISLKLRKHSVGAMKTMSDVSENKIDVKWASFDSNLYLSLMELWYEKWNVCQEHEKTKNKILNNGTSPVLQSTELK